jgi:hypothetical protein
VQLNGSCWLGDSDFEMWVQSDVLSIRRDAPLSGMFLRKYCIRVDFKFTGDHRPASCQRDPRAVPAVQVDRVKFAPRLAGLAHASASIA